MKRMVIASFVFCIGMAGRAHATWAGKLDISPTVNPCDGYDLTMRENAAGACHTFWHLDNNGKSRVNVGYQQLWNTSHGNPRYGVHAGLSGPDLGDFLTLLDNLYSLPSWLQSFKNSGAYLSIDGFGGYEPVVHRWTGGVLGYLNIPIGVASN